jgi:hypothetical protein
MIKTNYQTLGDLKEVYKEADRERKKRDYDAMKVAKRNKRYNVSN